MQFYNMWTSFTEEWICWHQNELLRKWQSFAAMNICRKEVCSILCNRNKIQKYMKFWSLRKTVTVVCVFSFGFLVLISNDSLFLNVGSEFKQIDDIYTRKPLWVFNIVCIFALYVRFYLKTRLHCSKKIKHKMLGWRGEYGV